MRARTASTTSRGETFFLAIAPARSAALIQHSSVLMGDSSGGDEAVTAAPADDLAGAREVGGEDQRVGIGVALDEGAARLGGALAVVAEAARPLGLGDLDDPVHEVAGEHGLATARAEPHADG